MDLIEYFAKVMKYDANVPYKERVYSYFMKDVAPKLVFGTNEDLIQLLAQQIEKNFELCPMDVVNLLDILETVMLCSCELKGTDPLGAVSNQLLYSKLPVNILDIILTHLSPGDVKWRILKFLYEVTTVAPKSLSITERNHEYDDFNVVLKRAPTLGATKERLLEQYSVLLYQIFREIQRETPHDISKDTIKTLTNLRETYQWNELALSYLDKIYKIE